MNNNIPQYFNTDRTTIPLTFGVQPACIVIGNYDYQAHRYQFVDRSKDWQEATKGHPHRAAKVITGGLWLEIRIYPYDEKHHEDGSAIITFEAYQSISDFRRNKENYYREFLGSEKIGFEQLAKRFGKRRAIHQVRTLQNIAQNAHNEHQGAIASAMSLWTVNYYKYKPWDLLSILFSSFVIKDIYTTAPLLSRVKVESYTTTNVEPAIVIGRMGRRNHAEYTLYFEESKKVDQAHPQRLLRKTEELKNQVKIIYEPLDLNAYLTHENSQVRKCAIRLAKRQMKKRKILQQMLDEV